MNLENSAFDPLREIGEWYFTKDHELIGTIVYDDTGLHTAGTLHKVEGIKSICEFTDDFIVKTHYAVYRLRKNTEKVAGILRVEVTEELKRRFPL